MSEERGAEYYYSKGIGTGIAMVIELVEGLHPTTSTAILDALKKKMEAINVRPDLYR